MSQKKTPLENKNSNAETIACLISFFQKKKTKYTIEQIYARFKSPTFITKNAIKKILADLVSQEKIFCLPQGKYTAKRPTIHYTTGKVDHVHPEYAYIICTDYDQDIRIRTPYLATAVDKDIVKIAIYNFNKKKRTEGKVVEIIQRYKTHFVGCVTKTQQGIITIVASNSKLYDPIIVPLHQCPAIAVYDKVVVAVHQWASPAYHAIEGTIVKILGEKGLHDTEMHAIMEEFGLPAQFPKEVEAEMSLIPHHTTLLDQRRDCRNLLTFTIDPDNAQDFDDALSFQTLSNGHVEVGIHIADVSHYVKKDSALDKEALQRGTSVYLVDRTVPMLPSLLSNDICSLKPFEDKYTFSVMVELDDHAQIEKVWVGKTMIHSDRRFTYEEAQKVINEEQKEDVFFPALIQLNQLAKKLRAKRLKNNAIMFSTQEITFQLDDQANIRSVLPKIIYDTHSLIEEFMLLANKQVANLIYKKTKGKAQYPFIYRTHGEPDTERFENFMHIVQQLGYPIHPKSTPTATTFNTISQQVTGYAEENLIQSQAIRTMAKALYTTQKTKHFGLGFDCYTHFTSPIRRYADLIVHRLVEAYLIDVKPVEDYAIYEKYCVHINAMERISQEAERASIKYKQVEWMRQFQGETFVGIIISMVEWGMYIEIGEIKSEGLLRFASMKDDHYVLDEQKMTLQGSKNKKTYRLGDKINVKIHTCNLEKRTIDLQH